ncbi:hypothetical protein, partial [Pseudomonas proteolytica]|uniref:hypothetical protein n=1 Tax=Pseudomonas proteolytica TaxID=219574 RepID=UPI001F3486C6
MSAPKIWQFLMMTAFFIMGRLQELSACLFYTFDAADETLEFNISGPSALRERNTRFYCTL